MLTKVVLTKVILTKVILMKVVLSKVVLANAVLSKVLFTKVALKKAVILYLPVLLWEGFFFTSGIKLADQSIYMPADKRTSDSGLELSEKLADKRTAD